jgi:hypothetical protein
MTHSRSPSIAEREASHDLAREAVSDLRRFLAARVQKASKGGRPSFLVQWARRVGVGRLAETTLSAILPTLWARPPGRRIVQRIITALGDVTGEQEIDELTASQGATLGWSLLVAATVSIRTPDGLPAISLFLDTTFRTRRGRLTKRDRYHVHAVESWMAGLEADPDSARLLIPREILLASPEALRDESTERTDARTCAHERARSVSENIGWEINRSVCEVVSSSGVGLTDRDRETLKLANILGGRTFRFRSRLNFRGEIESGPATLTPQSGDLARALLQFSQPIPLGPEGRGYLAAHGRRCYEGEDSLAGEDALKWVERNNERIVAAAERPRENGWWESAARPWQFLAFCFEWKRLSDLGWSEELESSLPIRIPHDSGSAYRRALNFVAGDMDLRTPDPSEFESLTFAELRRLAEGGSELASRWLSAAPRPGLRALLTGAIRASIRGLNHYAVTGVVRRAVERKHDRPAAVAELLKPVIGEVALNGKKACAHLARHGQEIDSAAKKRDRERLEAHLEQQAQLGDKVARLWLDSSLLDSLAARAAAGGSGTLIDHFKTSGQWGQVEEVFRRDLVTRYVPTLLDACSLLARCAGSVVSPEFADEVRRWTKEIVKHGEPAEWTLPLTGWTVRQPYMESRKKQAGISLAGVEIQPAYYETAVSCNVRRQLQRAPDTMARSFRAAEMAAVIEQIHRAPLGCVGSDRVGYSVPPGYAGVVIRAVAETLETAGGHHRRAA